MAAAFLDKLFAQQIAGTDRRIEETLHEIENVLKDTPKEASKSGTAEGNQPDRGTLTALDRQRFVQCIQKILEFCHSNPSSIDVIFDNLKDITKFGSLKPVSFVPQCHICFKVQRSTVTKAGVSENGTQHGDSNGYTHQKLPEKADEDSPPQHSPGFQTKSDEEDTSKRRQSDPKISSDKDVVSFWQSVCYHVNSYIVNELTTNPCFLSLHDSLVKKTKWQLYFSVLRVTFAPEQVQRLHRLVRTEQLNHFVCPCFPADDGADACLSCLCEFCILCLVEDISFLSIGYFRPLVVTWEELQAAYVTRIRGHVTKLLADLDNLKSSSDVCNESGNGRSTCNGLQSYSRHVMCLADFESCLNRTQNSESEAGTGNSGEERADGTRQEQRGVKPGGEMSSGSCRSQRRRSTGGLYVKQRRRSSASSRKRMHPEERSLLFSAVVQLVDELAWLDQQLRCICCIETYFGPVIL